MSDKKKLELADIVLKYQKQFTADCIEPEVPVELWMELGQWFEKYDPYEGLPND